MKSIKNKLPIIMLVVLFFTLWLYAIKNRDLHNESEVQNVSAMMHTGLTPNIMNTDVSEVENHDDTHESLDEVLAELLSKYNKDTIQELDCNDLSEEELERVGDAVMESMHPGEAHERMDAMMGGEGSESLRLMHLQMGQRYLGCDTSNSVSNFGMMGGGSMMGSPFGMSAFSPFGGVYSLLGTITWILFIVFLIAGIRWFWKKASRR